MVNYENYRLCLDINVKCYVNWISCLFPYVHYSGKFHKLHSMPWSYLLFITIIVNTGSEILSYDLSYEVCNL